MNAKLFDATGLAKHSGFGMAYYCYGMLAAITHALIMFNGIVLILNAYGKRPKQKLPYTNLPGNRFS